MIEVETAFPYLGSRDYIHGTSILSGLVTALEHQEGGALTVKRLKFQRPAQSNGRLFLTTAPLDEAEAAAANCTVQATLGTTVWRGIFRDTGAPVRQRLAVGYPIDDVVAADFGGHCAIAPLDRDDLIRTLIEANKRFHELSLDVPAGAVRFGYLENWKVPPADTRFSGLLQAKNLIMRKTPDGYMTINRLTYTTDGPDASLTLCFNVIGTAGYAVTIGIAALAHVYGGVRIDNVTEGARHGFDESFLRDKLGINTRYAATPAQATSDLAADAAHAVLDKTGTRAADIEALVVVTQTPDYQMPHTAALVQRRLGLSERIASFDMSLGCSGFVYGLSTLTALMAQNGYTRALLVTADCYSKVTDVADRATAPLFSDAAAACLITDQAQYRPGKALFGTDGAGAEALIVKSGGSRVPGGHSSLFMDGRAIYSFAMSRIPQHVEQCLALNGLRLEDIDRFVFHQANRFMLESLRDRMKLPADKVVIEVADGGNSVGSTIPIALEPLLHARPHRILLCGFGVGLSWATNVLELCDR